ncbi:hypothetical protein [Candidatus Villigracilis affinis]|uniref:hypothetical protein n=1 Tax=Candidatus Villigracilis affinis TaxID=3140682 RepID=UPI001D89741B|nr:hypothetical protein [Anaerolineales bacterium]
MSLSEEPIIPTEPTPPSQDMNSLPPRPRRRRATRRDMIPTDAEGQAALISELSRRAYPSIELFIFFAGMRSDPRAGLPARFTSHPFIGHSRHPAHDTPGAFCSPASRGHPAFYFKH